MLVDLLEDEDPDAEVCVSVVCSYFNFALGWSLTIFSLLGHRPRSHAHKVNPGVTVGTILKASGTYLPKSASRPRCSGELYT